MLQNELAFTMPGPPVPKARARKGAGGRWYTPAKTVAYENNVAAHASAARVNSPDRKLWPHAGSIELEVRCYMPDAKTRDADNVFKSVADALNKILWNDDNQVTDGIARKRIDRKNPRTEVYVRALNERPEE